MHAGVLGTAVEYRFGGLGGVELITPIVDPQAAARLSRRPQLATGRASDTGAPYNQTFAAMARSAGIEGVRIDRAADLGDAVRQHHGRTAPHRRAEFGADRNPGGADV
jgi:acetolactate synthase-1/2/3 large subunit